MKPSNTGSYFTYNRIAIKFAGLDASIYKNEKWKHIYFVWYSFLVSVNTLATIQCTVATVVNSDNKLVERSFVILYAATSLEAVCLLVYCYLRREKLEYILDKADRTFKYKSETVIDQVDMYRSIMLGRILVKWSSVSYFVGIHFLALWPLMSMSNERKLSIALWYPFDWRLSPFYEIAMGMIQIELYCATLAFHVKGTLIIAISVITKRQFEIIGLDFENSVYTALLKYGFSENMVRHFRQLLFIENCEWRGKTKHSSELILALEAIKTNKFRAILDQTFADCIKHHQNLLSFCNDLEDFFSPVLLSTICSYIFMLCILLFCLITEKDKSFQSGLIVSIISALFQLFICTFFGQTVTNESSELKNKLYKCSWYLCDANFKKNFAFVHLRCGRPVNLTAGKQLNLNFESFIKFLQTVFSYAAVLKQVTDRSGD